MKLSLLWFTFIRFVISNRIHHQIHRDLGRDDEGDFIKSLIHILGRDDEVDFIKSLINILGRDEVDCIKSGITPGTLDDDVDFIKTGITPRTLDADVDRIIRSILFDDSWYFIIWFFVNANM